MHLFAAANIVLVHGAWNTPLVWEPVRAVLEAAGFSVAAPDLPFDSTNRFTSDCAELITGLGDLSRSVVVAHTVGGLVTPVAAAIAPVGALAFVNPLLPEIGRSFAQQAEQPNWVDRNGSAGRRYDRDARSFWDSKSDFARCLAADCTPEQIDALWDQLRPQSRGVVGEVTPLERWPQIPSAVWIHKDDADLPVEWMANASRERLGTEPELHPGSQLGFYADPEPLASWIVDQLPS